MEVTMEVSEAATAEKETTGSICVKDAPEKQTNEVTEDASSNSGSACKRPKEKGSRYNLFDKVMQKSLDKLVDHASFNRFASTFRPLYKKNPQRMENIHKQFIEELRRTVQEDISRLIEEGRLEFKLNELDKLERAAKNKEGPAWRPSGVPEEDCCSFLMPYYLKQEAYMRLELKKIQAENAALAQKVQSNRESIALTEERISATVDEWKASVTEFGTLASSLSPANTFEV